MKAKFLAIGFAVITLASCGNKQKSSAENTTETEQAEESGVTVTEEQMKAVGIELGKVEEKPLNSSIRVNGQLSLDPKNRAEVTSLVGGIVRRIAVLEGNRVSAGQAVAYLENTDIVVLQKSYLTAKKEALIAEQEYNRQRELSEQGAGVQKLLQQASGAYEIAKAQLLGLEKQLQQLSINPRQVSLGNMTTQIPIKAPISGIVGKINASVGSYVDVQTSLMNIVDNSRLHCDLKIFEKDASAVHAGQLVDIILTNQPDVKLQAEIYEINSAFEGETKAIKAHAHLIGKTDAKLLPDMYVTGLINVGTQTADAVPSEAIVGSEGKKFIFVLAKEDTDGGKKTYHFEQAEVVPGTSELGYTQITPISKLDRNATIVTANAFYLASMLSGGEEEE